MQIFRNLGTKSYSNKSIEYTYGTNFPEFQISYFYSIVSDWFETLKLLVY